MKNIQKRMVLMAIAGMLGLTCNSPSSGSIQKTIVAWYFDADQVSMKTQQGITYINDQIANGHVFRLLQNDTIQSESYVDGKKDGLCYSKYPNHQYQYKQNFVNGRMEGIQRSWWENGQLKQEANYSNDVFNGSLKEWSSDGTLMRENNFEDGHETGKQRLWYDNGKLRANYIVKEGRIYGLAGTMNCFNATEKK